MILIGITNEILQCYVLQFAAMCSSIDLARIFLIEETNKGYTKLVLSNPIPWKTRYLCFNVWRKAKLHYDGKEYKVGDMVSVEYPQEDFYKLVSLEPVRGADSSRLLLGLLRPLRSPT